MFSQRYHKQLSKLLPLIQQDRQEQSNHPSNKHNSNDQESSECFTPNYNGIQDEEYKEPLIKYSHTENNRGNGQFFEDQALQSEDHAYNKMRQNPTIDYNKIFNSSFNFVCKDDSIREKPHQNIIITPPNNSQSYYSPDNSSLKPSSLQPIAADCNFRKQGATLQNQSLVSAEKAKDIQKNVIYEDISINGRPLSSQMLTKHTKLRWQLAAHALQPEYGLSFDKQTKNETEQCSEQGILNEKNSDKQAENLSQIKIDKNLLGRLEKLQKSHLVWHGKFLSDQKLVEAKYRQIALFFEPNLSQLAQTREGIEDLATFKYQKLKNHNFLLFQQEATKSTEQLCQSVEKRFQKANIQVTRNKRLAKQQIERQWEHFSQQIQSLQHLVLSEEKTHNQKISQIYLQFQESYTGLDSAIYEAKKQISLKEAVIEEKIQTLDNKFTAYINKQAFQEEQVEVSLLRLVQSLVQKMQQASL